MNLFIILIFLLTTRRCDSYRLELCQKETNPNRICKVQETYHSSEVPDKEKITIQSFVNIFDIFDVDETNHFIGMYLQMYYTWVDPRLYFSNLTEKYVIERSILFYFFFLKSYHIFQSDNTLILTRNWGSRFGNQKLYFTRLKILLQGQSRQIV